MGIEVLEGGVQTTVQELPGRVGFLDLGIYPGGPMDHDDEIEAGRVLRYSLVDRRQVSPPFEVKPLAIC